MMTDPTTGVATVHMQLQRMLTFHLISVHDNLKRLGAPQITVYVFACIEDPYSYLYLILDILSYYWSNFWLSHRVIFHYLNYKFCWLL
jgi:putative flippase GtrA